MPIRPMFIAGNWKMNPATAEARSRSPRRSRRESASRPTSAWRSVPPRSSCTGSTRRSPARRSGSGARTCTGSPTARIPARCPARCSRTPGAPTSSSATASAARPGRDRRAGQRQAARGARGRADPDRLHRRDPPGARAGQTEDVVAGQLTGSLAGLSDEQMAGTVLAYEPVWAIGTGLTASPGRRRRSTSSSATGSPAFGQATAARVVVQYGGSVKPDNAGELSAAPISTAPSSAGPASRRPTSSGSSRRRKS